MELYSSQIIVCVVVVIYGFSAVPTHTHTHTSFSKQHVALWQMQEETQKWNQKTKVLMNWFGGSGVVVGTVRFYEYARVCVCVYERDMKKGREWVKEGQILEYKDDVSKRQMNGCILWYS